MKRKFRFLSAVICSLLIMNSTISVAAAHCDKVTWSKDGSPCFDASCKRTGIITKGYEASTEGLGLVIRCRYTVGATINCYNSYNTCYANASNTNSVNVTASISQCSKAEYFVNRHWFQNAQGNIELDTGNVTYIYEYY